MWASGGRPCTQHSASSAAPAPSKPPYLARCALRPAPCTLRPTAAPGTPLPQVKLQFESRDKAALQAAVEAVRAQLPDTFTLPGRK